jgi:hypothetical protein
MYTEKTVTSLPEIFRPKHISTRLVGNTLHFFTAATALSNHAPTPFELDGIQYCNMEQYWMASKAAYFVDTEMQNKVMTMENPVLIKRAAKKIHNIDDTKWRKDANPIILKGLKAKFRQSKWAKDTLLSSGQFELAECTAHDRWWSTGLPITSENLLQRPWPGGNQMGIMLMKVRDEIRKDDERAGIPPPPLNHGTEFDDTAGNRPTIEIIRPQLHAINTVQLPATLPTPVTLGPHSRVQLSMMALADTHSDNIDIDIEHRRPAINLPNATFVHNPLHTDTMDIDNTGLSDLEEGETRDSNE